MASPAVDLGSGWALTFAGITYQIMSARWTGIERASQDVTHLGTAVPSGQDFANREFLPGLMVDPGQLELVAHFNPDDVPPVHGAAATGTATWPSTGGLTPATWAADMFLQSMEIDGIGIDEVMVANLTMKLTGNITLTAAT